MDTADANGATLILATDPDADRLAVAEKTPSYLELQFTPYTSSGQWKIFNGNEIGVLLGYWVWCKFHEANPTFKPSIVVCLF